MDVDQFFAINTTIRNECRLAKQQRLIHESAHTEINKKIIYRNSPYKIEECRELIDRLLII